MTSTTTRSLFAALHPASARDACVLECSGQAGYDAYDAEWTTRREVVDADPV